MRHHQNNRSRLFRKIFQLVIISGLAACATPKHEVRTVRVEVLVQVSGVMSHANRRRTDICGNWPKEI
ncbi:hypothetical protein PSYRMG_04595 [Pseudomonas syringae UMAF0158]|nr:hypothetical protein PSYRMG_04595 [Pseudomonas syringae UMAF0158]